MTAPVRLCCGQRHYEAQCPDGLVMCCLCFSRFPVSELHVTGDGTPEDVCQGCAAAGNTRTGRTITEQETWTMTVPVQLPPAHIHEDDGTVEGCPGCFWDPDVTWILAAIELVDAHLDAAAPEIYRQDNDASRLANRWRRLAAGPASEGQEAVDELNLSTGGNPRKGVIGDQGTVLKELGDCAVASLLAIQSETKNTGATWEVFLAALAKALNRVPDGNPS